MWKVGDFEKPTFKCRNYSPTSMTKAFLKCKESGTPIRTTARQYGVPEATLRHKLKGRTNPEAVRSGPQPLFTQEEEAFLVEHLKFTASVGYGYTYFSRNATTDDKEFGTKSLTTSNISGVGVDTNDIQSMIEQQATLCPYIPLCTLTNRSTSTFITNKTGEYPCCSKCSCQPSCIAEESCCPDVTYKSITENKPPKEEQIKNTSNRLRCVKAYYGMLHKNINGYKMIASCKTNFTDNTVKYLCERTYEESLGNIYSLVDVLPINHKESGQYFKNIFCYLCNRDGSQSHPVSFHSVSFWDSYLHCSVRLGHSRYIELDPLHSGRSLFQHGCRIEFKRNFDSERDLEPCRVSDVIETCLVGHADTKLESLCNFYSWPITSKSTDYYSTHETFKNLACLLCNDRIFSKTCFEVIPERPTYTVSLTRADPFLVSISLKNGTKSAYSGNQIFLNRTINRYFPDSKGNLLCEKGFIFDDEKNECRQVFCPDYFFLNNGSCSPILNQTKGLHYFHHFHVIFPTSVYGVDTDELEEFLFSTLNQRLPRHFGNESYDISLWCNTNSREKMNMNRNYVVSIIIGNEFKCVSYIDVLGIFHLITRRNVLADIKENPKNVYEGVEFRFTSRYIYFFSKLKDLSGGTLYLRRSTYETFKDFDNKLFEVSISQLCYRLLLDFSEIKGDTLPSAIRVGKSDTLLLVPNFQILRTGNDMSFMVCLENTLYEIAEANKYIFFTTEQTNENEINRGDKHGKGSEDKSYILTESTAVPIERSLAMTIATAVFVLIIVGIRISLKRLRRIEH